MPRTAMLLAGGGIAVPFAASAVASVPTGPGAALWLLALIPLFIAAYHRGPRGAAGAAAAVIGAMVVAELMGRAMGRAPSELALMIGVAGALLAVAAGVAWITEQLYRDRDRAEQLALTDVLTGIPNRRYAMAVLEQEFAAAKRGRRLVLALLDLDEFKRYNDLHGHAAGDEALRVFGAALASTTRQMNLSARFGGEEFLSILSDTDADGTLIFLERVRRSLDASGSPHAAVTFSAGVAAFSPEFETPEELIAAADAALYRAKAMGRNRAEIHAEPLAVAG